MSNNISNISIINMKHGLLHKMCIISALIFTITNRMYARIPQQVVTAPVLSG